MAKTLDEAGVKRLIQEIKGANKNPNAPIPISTENTPESMAQNVKNIADYVEKAKAAGIANVNGMAVTCLIDGENSGVGYLYVTNSQVLICGILAYEDNNVSSISVIDGTYREQSIVIEGHIGQVTSDMLAEGARNPIIITGDMTEVNEETYQKLLKGDTDVIADFGGGIFIEPQAKFNTGDTLNLIFGYSQFDENDGAIATYTISINTSAPHTLTLAVIGLCEPVSKSALSPVLQEIDLTGTDADRKAKLDQFETDWKALTGASDLTGARFVGFLYDSNQKLTDGFGVFTFDVTNNGYSSICSNVNYEMPTLIIVSCEDGSLTITPLFAHLEAITIYTGNTPEHMQANLDNIAAYEANLRALGVDTTKGWNAPVSFSNGNFGTLFYIMEGEYYSGIMVNKNTVTSPYSYGVRKSDGYFYTTNIITQASTISSLTTTSKKIVGAINEVNALAKGYSTIFTPIELTTETAQNKTAIDARVAAFTAQGISLTNGCCIPVTYKGVYAGNISLINGDWYGLLVKNTNNPADNINIKLSADGTITEGNSVQ